MIRSFNEDKPYPQFVREQLAGDVLQPVTRDGLIATGFLVAGPWDEVQNVGKSKLEKMRTHEEQLEELIGAVSQSFLGITVNCARCHDHKFDPVPQTDYYRLKAVFDGVDHGNRSLFTPEEQQAHEQRVKPIRARIKEIKSSLEEFRNSAPADATIQAAEPVQLLTEGPFGQALDARRGHAETPSKPLFHKPPFTVECWGRLFSKGSFNILAANNRKESPDHWELYTYAGTGVLSAYFPGFTPSEIKSAVDVIDGAWHYLAISFDGERVKLYVDAKLVHGKDSGWFAIRALPRRPMPVRSTSAPIRLTKSSATASWMNSAFPTCPANRRRFLTPRSRPMRRPSGCGTSTVWKRTSLRMRRTSRIRIKQFVSSRSRR